VAVGWRFTEEDFLENVKGKVLTTGKLRHLMEALEITMVWVGMSNRKHSLTQIM
jgi:hypothetical protein